MRLEELREIAPRADALWGEVMIAEMPKWGITGMRREAAFVAVAAHATEGFTVFSRDAGSGDLYRPRGIAMLAGKDAYRAFGNAVGVPAESKPDLLLTPSFGVMSGCWYWKHKGLAALADSGEFEALVLRWSGALKGLKEREEFYGRALEVLA